jgi:hypothetical protein
MKSLSLNLVKLREIPHKYGGGWAATIKFDARQFTASAPKKAEAMELLVDCLEAHGFKLDKSVTIL